MACGAQRKLIEEDLVVLPHKVDQQKAAALCAGRAMKLLKVEDEETNQMVAEFAERKNLGYYWLDGNDLDTRDRYVYNEGSPLRYRKFYPGEPNHLNNSEFCIHGGFIKIGFWNDDDCDSMYTGICTKPLVKLTENDLVALSVKVGQQKAAALCQAQGMRLIKVEDEDTNQVVAEFASKKKLDWYWLDGNDLKSVCHYVYQDGSPLRYSKWYRGEPSHYAYTEFCIHGGYLEKSYWNDIDCLRNLSVICTKHTVRAINKAFVITPGNSSSLQPPISLGNSSSLRQPIRPGNSSSLQQPVAPDDSNSSQPPIQRLMVTAGLRKNKRKHND